MGVLWLIEKSDLKESSVAPLLQGDFAVRLFGSPESFLKLARLRQVVGPDALVVNMEGLTGDVERLDQRLDCHDAAGVRIYVNVAGDIIQKAAVGPGVYLVPKIRCSMGLCEMIKRLVSRDCGEACAIPHEIRYRNLRLDADRLVLCIHPASDEIALPLKEARLLKLFMSNPGRCMSRDVLREVIWDSMAVSPRTIDSHVSRLRKRLAYAEVTIDSVYGDGYVLR